MSKLRSPTVKGQSGLSESAHQKLRLYALGATAAGVTLLTFAQPANAEIVYTPTDLVLNNGSLLIDVNDDGTVDFTLHDNLFESGTYQGNFFVRRLRLSGSLAASAVGQAGIADVAAALASGSVIGSSRSFRNAHTRPIEMAVVGGTGCGSSCGRLFSRGPWLQTQNLYLGLKFEINNEVHYGWARLNTKSSKFRASIEAKLSGYAYETVPNQSITAGQTSEANVSVTTPGAASPSARTLGRLAKGTQGSRESHQPVAQPGSQHKAADH